MHSAQIKYNDRYSEFYKQLYNETHEKRYLNKADSIYSCFKFQYWDKYEYNKILDNIAHDRCRNRFCLNCQILINSYHAHKLRPIMENLKKEGYSAYMLTLTVPNCKYEDLNSTIKKIELDYNPSTSEIIIRNSGETIPERKLNKIFELFYSDRPNGRGLGLYLAKQSLNDCYYDIYATNDAEFNTLQGACFIINPLNK